MNSIENTQGQFYELYENYMLPADAEAKRARLAAIAAQASQRAKHEPRTVLPMTPANERDTLPGAPAVRLQEQLRKQKRHERLETARVIGTIIGVTATAGAILVSAYHDRPKRVDVDETAAAPAPVAAVPAPAEAGIFARFLKK